MSNAVWRPQPRQIEFMTRTEYEVLYGGAAGGGKSDALLAEALRQVNVPNYRAIIFRKTYPQLSELIDRSYAIYKPAFPRAAYNDSKHVWVFPTGAKIWFGTMQHEQDRKNYQGKRFDFIAFDELTHFQWSEYSYMFSRNRPSGPGTECYIRATTNPGGVGHAWVKDRFIDAAPPMTPIDQTVSVRDPNGKVITIKNQRAFVPATVFDNQILLQDDPNYLASLGMLPEAERDALLYGDWESFEGQVFREWKNDSTHYEDRQWTHVIDDFLVPDDWRIYRGFDFGYSKPFSVGWFAVDHDGRLYRIREAYGCTGTPNEGVKYEPEKIAELINEVEDSDPNLKGKQIIGIADPAIYEESKGESIATMLERKGVYFEKADNKRLPGKMQCHYRLAFDDNGIPMFYCFKSCRDFIRCIPSLIYSERHVEDVDTDMEDHNYDEWRYVCMENPINPRITKKQVADLERLQNDPLDLFKDEREKLYGRYNYVKL